MKSIIISFMASFLLCLSWMDLCKASDLSYLYDKETLTYWDERYQNSTGKIMKMIIWPALYSNEMTSLGNQEPVIEFPLWAKEEEVRGHPLAFYVPPGGDRIVFPVFSLKFLDDLCTAYAWLQLNGYSLETVSEYTAILRYGKPKDGKFPRPLEALHIPRNALDDPKVNELALSHFVTARTFILLHEMGHIVYRHYAYRSQTLEESIRDEQEADRFATDVMQRTKLLPLGIILYFMADAHWSGYPPIRYSHPLSGERVRQLSDNFEDLSISAALDSLGTWLDDPEIRAGFVATGKAGDLEALIPRRPGELPRRAGKNSNDNSSTFFSGTYRGEFLQNLGNEPLPAEVVLERKGDYVMGSFNFGLGFGKIEGQVTGNKLYFDWEWLEGNYGRGVFAHRDEDSFSGEWGYRESRTGAGTWNGNKATIEPQSGSQTDRIKRNLSGQKFLLTYREGEAVYGTYFFLEMHFCNSGNYIMFGQSRKRTILDNEQVNNLEEYGTWDVILVQGQVLLQTRTTSGTVDYAPIQLLSDGSLWIRDGVTIQRQGRAQCN